MYNRNSAEVWNYFDRSGDEALCKKCTHKVTCKGSTTTPMLNHLKLKHMLDLSGKRSNNGSSNQSTNSKKFCTNSSFSNLFKRQQLNEIVARLVSEDGFTVNGITKSSFIRQSISDKGFSLPKNPAKVMDLVISYFKEQKSKTVEILNKRVNSGERFSLTLDEWTSVANKRYININIHCKDSVSFNLGLVRIIGICDAKETQRIVIQHLKEFGISLEKDIVASTTDGASVMCKFGRESPAYHVQCMNHAIHLAVMDIFYKNNEKLIFHEEACDRNHLDIPESDNDYSDFDELDDGEIFVENYEQDHCIILLPNYQTAIKEIRQVVDFFRRSPTRNTILQRYVKQEFKKEISLIRDIKIRWNSLEAMIERFLKLYSCIKISLIELNATNKICEANITTLKDMLAVLSPLKVAVEALSRKDATILTCETIVTFLLNKLTEVNSCLSIKFREILVKRINERRNKQMVSVLKFLHNSSSSTGNKWFSLSSKTVTLTYAKELIQRLFPILTEATAQESEEDIEILNCDEPEPASVADELNLEISKSQLPSMPNKDKNFYSLGKEFQIYEATGIRSRNLDLLYYALLTVKPTSTESERVFSTSGIVVSRLRTRMRDEAINAVVFLRSWFQSHS